MKILLDECLPKRLTRLLPGHDVRTVGRMNWLGLSNGRLLDAAAEFDLFITVDKNLVKLHLLLVFLLLASASTLGATSTQPAATSAQPASAPATQPDLSTPQKAAIAFFHALFEEDGQLLLACLDTRDPGVKKIMMARAAQFDAAHHYRISAQKKFGQVPAEFLPPTDSNFELIQLLIKAAAQSPATIDADRASLTPELPHGPNEPTMGGLFQLRTREITS